MTDLCHTYQKKLIEIPLSQIIPNPMQPRTNFYESDISELSASIKQLGIINPVCVRPYRGRYELIAGERRFRAAKMAGIYSMPCIIINADDEEASLMALTENIQRKNLNYFEQANAMNLILKTSSITQSELAQKLGKSQSAVANKLRLLKIPPYIQRFLLDAHMKERHARALLKLEDANMMYKVAETAVKQKMNADKLESYIDSLLSEKQKSPKNIKASIKGFCRDLRLYINTLNHTVDIMRNSGINTIMEKTENETSIVYKIVINK